MFLVWPIAARFCVPWAFTFFQLPGAVLFSMIAINCVICFVLCPRWPLPPKLATLLLMIFALYWALDSAAYYFIYSLYHE